MCKRNVSGVFRQFGIAFYRAASGSSMECVSDSFEKGWQKDRDTICSVFNDGIYRNDFAVKFKYQYVKGSYTIEASLIFPIVLFTVIFILYSAFYMHNRAVLQETAYEMAIYASNLDYRDTEEMKRKMWEKYQNAIEGRLISMKEPEVSMEVKSKDITVRISAEMTTVPLVFFQDYNHAVIQVKKSVSMGNPLSMIRGIKAIKRVTE